MSGIVSHHAFDGDDLIVNRTQDVEPILDDNKAMANEPQHGDFRHIGSIPVVIIEKWMNEDGVNILAMGNEEFSAFIERKLNDPDWRHLKTYSGRI